MFRHQSSTSSYQAYDIVLFGFAISYVLCLGACEIVDLFGTLHDCDSLDYELQLSYCERLFCSSFSSFHTHRCIYCLLLLLYFNITCLKIQSCLVNTPTPPIRNIWVLASGIKPFVRVLRCSILQHTCTVYFSCSG